MRRGSQSKPRHRWHISGALVLLVAFAGIVGAQVPDCSIQTQLSGTNSQLGRVFRDSTPSMCPGKAYPGLVNPTTPYFYEAFTYTNVTAATVCVTVNFDPTVGASPCANPGLSKYNAHASAYLTSYDPSNQGTNFVGDVGSSDTGSFSFDVPASTDAVIVVTNTSAAEACTFGFEVVGLDCVQAEADLSVTKSVDSPAAGPGSAVTFTINVANVGPSTATGVVVVDTLPAGLTFVSTSGCSEDPNGVPTCTLGDISSGSSASYTVAAIVALDPPAVIVNSATASSTTTDPSSSNNTGTATVSTSTGIPTVDTTGLVLLAFLLALVGILSFRRV